MPITATWQGATLGANTFTGVQTVPVGSASSPSVNFAGDVQTGFFQNGAGIIDLSFVNSARVRFRNTQFQMGSSVALGWSSTTAVGTADMALRRRAAADLQMGSADAASPVAQTISVQGVVAGTADTAGVLWTFAGSVSTGLGVGGDIKFTVTPAGSTGSTQNAAVDALTLKGNKSVIIGSAALATDATDGFLYIPTCAGTPTGVPTAVTGRIPMVFDTSNSQFWFYLNGWKQPKTPAAAAIITWQ